MASLATIYLRLVGSRIRSQVQYRASFVLSVVGNVVVTGLDLVGILVFFHHVPALGGWSFREIAFLYGSSLVCLRVGDAIVGHIEQLGTYIRAGSFDTFLMRPLGSLFQIVTADFSVRQLGGALQGAIVFGWAIAGLPVEWTAARAGLVALMLTAGFVIFLGIWIATNSIAFWFIDTREMANAFTYGGNFVSQYPLHIFGGWLRRFLTGVVPIAFVNYFPSLAILGRSDPFGAPRALSFLSPAVAVAVAIAARLTWRAGVRRYQSTGS